MIVALHDVCLSMAMVLTIRLLLAAVGAVVRLLRPLVARQRLRRLTSTGRGEP